MIVLRCTRRVVGPLGLRGLFDDAPQGTSRLGDWYVNLYPSRAGEFFLFVNERSLAGLVVPRSEPYPLHAFVRRFANLLAMLGVEHREIDREIEHHRDYTVAKTKSRSVLTSMSWIAYYCQVAFETGPFPVSLRISRWRSQGHRWGRWEGRVRWLSTRRRARADGDGRGARDVSRLSSESKRQLPLPHSIANTRPRRHRRAVSIHIL